MICHGLIEPCRQTWGVCACGVRVCEAVRACVCVCVCVVMMCVYGWCNEVVVMAAVVLHW